MPLAHSPCYAPPKGLLTPWGVAPHPFATWQGCRGKPPAPLPRALGRLQPVKGQAASGCFASHDRFPAPSASDRFATPTEVGVKGGVAVHFTLDALESTTHRRGGRWIGLPPAPAASVKWGLGQSPKVFFVFDVVRVNVTVQKRSKKCAF